jgi:hypothetical protein
MEKHTMKKEKTTKTPKQPTHILDDQGREIPVSIIDKNVLKRNLVVNNGFAMMIDYVEKTKTFKKAIFDMVINYLDSIAEEFGETWQGNTVLLNFSHTQRIHIDVQKTIGFDEKLNIAKKKIDACMRRWTEGSNEAIRLLVMDAFAVDKKGNVNVKLILGLRKYKFEDDDWKSAMDIISEAILVESSKTYIRFSSRKDSNANWEFQTLNFSSVKVED